MGLWKLRRLVRGLRGLRLGESLGTPDGGDGDRASGGSLFVQLVGTETARTTVLEIVIWATFAAFQGAALALVAIDGPGCRSLLPLATLWVPASAIGGVLAVAASSSVVAAAFPVGGFDIFFDRILPSIVGLTTAGALYGAATGVVLAIIVRRSAVQEDSTR